ncbi:hypothetical protein Tco_0926709 [Tanacetum coccineum]|uniref:Uncharacterized protein n=1 Tax=Tanacetum coccineum TaxID=301880 RepID=A0ABQ5DAJ4_9ASTR
MGRGLAQRPVIVGVSHDLRGDSWGYVPRSLFWREDLDGDGEHRFDCLTFALVSSKAHREGCRASCGGFPCWEMVLEIIERIGVIDGRNEDRVADKENGLMGNGGGCGIVVGVLEGREGI